MEYFLYQVSKHDSIQIFSIEIDKNVFFLKKSGVLWIKYTRFFKFYNNLL